MVSAPLVTQGDLLLCGKTTNESDFMQRLHDPTQADQTRGIGKKMFPRLKVSPESLDLKARRGKNGKTKQTNTHLSCTNLQKYKQSTHTKYLIRINKYMLENCSVSFLSVFGILIEPKRTDEMIHKHSTIKFETLYCMLCMKGRSVYLQSESVFTKC